MRKRIPTDLRILDAIYKRYYAEFVKFEENDRIRRTKIYVPIDIKQVADDLAIDGDIIFGRLYYHLGHKYGYKEDDGRIVYFFTLGLGGDVHCVNFPLMASVLADLQDQARKHSIALWIAVGSLLIAVGSVVVSVFALWYSR